VEFRVEGSGFRVVKVQGSGFSRSRAEGSGFRVEDLELRN
jgi:hypothetical protein